MYCCAWPRTGPTTTAAAHCQGVLVATPWVAVSLGFSLYVDNFGSYGATYGALAGVVVLLLWLWIGLFAILLGAAIDAVREEGAGPLEEEAASVIAVSAGTISG